MPKPRSTMPRHETLVEFLGEFKADVSEVADIIELDEIYTFVQKNSNGQQFGLLTLGRKNVLLRLK